MESNEVLEELSDKDKIWYYGSHENNVRKSYLFMTNDEVEEEMFGEKVICPYAVAFECYKN